MGYVRLILAITVVLSHMDVRIYGLTPGVIAVVIFYMLAGGVVSHIWNDILPDGRGKLISFYKDRCLRIFPLYIYTVVLTLIFLLITNYGSPEYSAIRLGYNALIIPLNYFMVLDSTVMTAPAWNLVPPAWSLATEMQAYLVLPLVLQYKKLRLVLVVVSLAVYAVANLSYIHTDYFGYRLLPGVLFIFLLGSALRNWQDKQVKRLIIGGFVVFLAHYIYLESLQQPPHVYAIETVLGILIGIPLLIGVHQVKKKLPLNRLAGQLSYGVFVTHFLMIWLVDYTQWLTPNGYTYYITVILMATITAWIGIYLFERRIDGIRMKKPNK